MTADDVVADSPTAVLARAEGCDEPLVFAISGMTFSRMYRYGLFAETDTLTPIATGFIAIDAVDAVLEALSAGHAVSRGGWDAMFATGWEWVWREAPFALWEKGQLVAETTDAGLRVRGVGCPVAPLQLHVSSDWTTRELKLGTVVLASDVDLFPTVDPTYDRFNLDADVEWLEKLGRAVARALGTTFTGI
ncbi:MAG: hypothetical protein EP330_11525 [Deltaproteobacteria bacterium]|nr:MAG: hypothetical protein EP330_11525 [Deltaproteobacteria bacterium]